jgi:hypothetical protein
VHSDFAITANFKMAVDFLPFQAIRPQFQLEKKLEVAKQTHLVRPVVCAFAMACEAVAVLRTKKRKT